MSRTGEVAIRDATPRDLDCVVALQVSGFRATFGPALDGMPDPAQHDLLLRLRLCRPQPAGGLVVAEHNGRLVGVTEWSTADLPRAALADRLRVLRSLGVVGAARFILWTRPVGSRRRETGLAYLPGTVVADDFRGMGVGRRLLTHSLDTTAAMGVHIWRDFVAEDNRSSRAMLAALGFIEVRRIVPPAWQRRLHGPAVSIEVEKRVEGGAT